MDYRILFNLSIIINISSDLMLSQSVSDMWYVNINQGQPFCGQVIF